MMKHREKKNAPEQGLEEKIPDSMVLILKLKLKMRSRAFLEVYEAVSINLPCP